MVNALADSGVVKNNVSKVIMETMNDAQNPFAGLDTNFKQLSYIKKNFNYVGYSEEVLGEKLELIIIYHDALEVCNPLGSHAGTHKLDMFYYTLGNLDPKVRSKRCAIRLLAIVKSNLVKKYGYNAILRPIISDIKKLECGRLFTVGGKERKVFGKVVSCAGDTEGQHEWGGGGGGL